MCAQVSQIIAECTAYNAADRPPFKHIREKLMLAAERQHLQDGGFLERRLIVPRLLGKRPSAGRHGLLPQAGVARTIAAGAAPPMTPSGSVPHLRVSPGKAPRCSSMFKMSSCEDFDATVEEEDRHEHGDGDGGAEDVGDEGSPFLQRRGMASAA